jgi:hypothetical protein
MSTNFLSLASMGKKLAEKHLSKSNKLESKLSLSGNE